MWPSASQCVAPCTHSMRVIGIAQLVPVLLAGNGVGAGRQHLVDRVEAAAELTGLRAGAVERNAEREHLAGADQPCGIDDVLRRDVVQGADLVVLAPAALVPELLAGFGDRVLVDLDVHRACPWFSAAPSSLRLRAQYCDGPRCSFKRVGRSALQASRVLLRSEARCRANA